MIKRLSDPNHGISIIQDSESEDTDISYCPECQLYRKKQVRLGPLIILDESAPLAPDYDNFKQCPKCYTVIPIYDVRTEGKLYSDLEPIKNRFDFGNVELKGIENKGLKNRLKNIKKQSREEEYSKDKEVMKEVREGAVISSYYSTI